MLAPTIYRIDKEHYLLNNVNTSIAIIGKIFTAANLKGRKLDINKITSFKFDEVTYLIYHDEHEETESDWEFFLPPELKLSESLKNLNISLLLFFEAHKELFCVIGGTKAFNIITPFIDHSFGLDTYSRIMSPSDDDLISIQTRGITGRRAGIKELYRDTFKILDFVKFGKVPNEVNAKLSVETSALYFSSIQTRLDERINISAGKGFKIKKNISFLQLHKIIQEFGNIFQLAIKDNLSSFKEIKDKNIIEKELKPLLIDLIFNDLQEFFKNNPDSNKRFNFDFCNPNDIEKFYDADIYKLKEKDGNHYRLFYTVTDKNEIYNQVLNRALNQGLSNNKFQFQVFLQGIKIYCYKSNTSRNQIKSNFLNHFTAELTWKGKPVFLIDTKWYLLRDSFIGDLETATTEILRKFSAPENILTKFWDPSTMPREDNYNNQYLYNNNYLVLDKILYQGIELCDIIYYDSNNTYLIHVKKGFDRKMRELTSQIKISGQRLKNDIMTNKLMLKYIYAELKRVNKNNNLTDAEFIQLFEKNITYILAFTSQLNTDYLVSDNVEKYSSNIARYSLISCSNEMRSEYYDLKTYQIRRE